MKKLLTLALVFSLAVVLSNVSFAQEEAVADEEAPVMLLAEAEVSPMAAPCPCAGPCAGACAPRCRLFGARRAACNPCFANPCNPCPPQPTCGPCQPEPMCGPCAPKPLFGCRKNACAPAPACNPCGSPCAGPCDDACGFGCGVGNHAPLRNFFKRVFSPRPYYGYDAYYGPHGDCFGCSGSNNAPMQVPYAN